MALAQTSSGPQSAADLKQLTIYTVYVDDNFHCHKGERRCAGQYETPEEAIAKCQVIVKESIESLCKPGMMAG